jgi:hypothetical protein
MSDLRVWYGFSKLTKKAVRKHELAIYFENGYSFKNEDWIFQKLHIVHVRKQTIGEAGDNQLCNRMFMKYGYFIDEKPYFGDIEAVLEQNFLADSNNVPEDERNIIRDKLRQAYYQVYDVKPIQEKQLKFIFN